MKLTKEQKRIIDGSDKFPITMVTTRSDTEIIYEVVAGDITSGDFGNTRYIWTKTVVFGATDATVAGGYAFTAAAREQQAIADAAFAYARGTECDTKQGAGLDVVKGASR